MFKRSGTFNMGGKVTISLLVFAVLVKHCISESTTQPDRASCKRPLNPQSGKSIIGPTIPKNHVAILLLLGFGGFSLLIAGGYRSLRKYVFKDEHNLDTVFDAGGRVSFSLTAVTVTSQLLWPTDFLQASTLTARSGLGGTLWYSVSVVIDILLFPTLSLFLKTRAPGAKTFPQIANARFGKSSHILFCVLALFTNLFVTTSILLAGKAALDVLCKDANNEFIFLVLAVLFGSYCLIGGLGTTFYISYFNTALTFVTVSVFVFYTNIYPSEDIQQYTTLASTYEVVSCIDGPSGNADNSLITFRTESGIIYGIVILFMATSLNFTDQANWQARIAAKPSQGVLGFFVAAYIWIVIPTLLSFNVCMSYFAISAENGTHLLTDEEIDNGYITPFVMNYLLGEMGGYLLLTMLMMSLMSTGSGEVMAISSIVVYDIYKTYINPFRQGLTPTSCILCGREKMLMQTNDNKDDFCQCPSVANCTLCQKDIEARLQEGVDLVTYKCSVHGRYRKYEDGLLRYKSWCMVWIIILIVPYGLIISETGMNLTWATLTTSSLTTAFLIPLFCTVTWAKATEPGVITGAVIGVIASIAGLLIAGSTYEGGLSDFYSNTSQPYSLLASMAGGFIISGILTVAISLKTHKISTEKDEEHEWKKTINIDNPINPFRLIYEEELAKVDAGTVITAKTMGKIFQKTKTFSLAVGLGSIVIFLVIVPAVALSFGELSQDQFSSWMKFFQIYCFICTVIVVVIPPFEEGYQIYKRYRKNKNITQTTDNAVIFKTEKL